jgi:molecular chaperone DnaK
MANGNKSLGRFHLDGIPPAMRGIPQVEVTFDIDANGILHVSAKDKGTGKSQQIRIEASSGLTDADIKRMREEAELNAEADRKAKEEVDKINQADSLIFQTERQLVEFGDKLPADKKEPIEQALNKLREAHKNRDIAGIDSSMAELNSVWQAASEEIYKATQQPGQPGAEQQGQPEPDQAKPSDQEVTDVDFEEVK